MSRWNAWRSEVSQSQLHTSGAIPQSVFTCRRQPCLTPTSTIRTDQSSTSTPARPHTICRGNRSKASTMLSTLQARYQRMEKALDALVDSVTAYNPSVTAADELVAADEDVNEGLEERRSCSFVWSCSRWVLRTYTYIYPLLHIRISARTYTSNHSRAPV